MCTYELFTQSDSGLLFLFMFSRSFGFRFMKVDYIDEISNE